MRVPVGFLSSLIMTAAFSSKRTYVPSWRLVAFAVRTTTALTTSPFLTWPPGFAFLTEATITSPIPAYLRPEPPRTLMHLISFAPELSATLRKLYCCTIKTPPYLAFSIMLTKRHLLSLERGRVSITRTLSPIRHSFNSSCALRRYDRAIIFLYLLWATRSSTRQLLFYPSCLKQPANARFS